MEQVLRLNWPRCRDGYSLIQFDARKVDWPRYESDGVAQQQQLTEDEQRFLLRWGRRLRLNQPGDEQEQWFLEKSAREVAPEILAKEPRLFSKLSAAQDDDEALLEFVDEHGLLWTDAPCSMSHVRNCAEFLHNLIERRNSEARRNTSNWLKKAVREFRTGFNGDIHVVPEAKNNKIQMTLLPNDLRVAMLLQFIFFGSKDLEINQCACCRNYIPKGARQNRADRKYCSNSCRQRDYRKRKQNG